MNQLRSHPFQPIRAIDDARKILFYPAHSRSHNPISVVSGAGTKDKLSFFRCRGSKYEKDLYILLFRHPNNLYVGVEVIHYNPKESRWEVLDQAMIDNEDDTLSVLGPKGFNLTPVNIAKRMVEIHG